jgi:large subunit ribosomal protein L47
MLLRVAGGRVGGVARQRCAVRDASRALSSAARGGAGKGGLSEFFDGSGNGAAGAFRTGRAWHASELRLKGFDDLHKLWYVCWKEKNKLLTERQIAKTLGTEMANPERMGKVKKTMARIKTVLSERRILHQNAKATSELRDLLREELVKERQRAHIDNLVKQARNDPKLDLDKLKEEYLKEQYAKSLELRAQRKAERIKAEEEAEQHKIYLNSLMGREPRPKLQEYRRVVQLNKGNFTRPAPKPFFSKSER